MRKTRWQKFHHTIRHTILKTASLQFVPGISPSPRVINNTIYDNFPTSLSRQILCLVEFNLLESTMSSTEAGGKKNPESSYHRRWHIYLPKVIWKTIRNTYNKGTWLPTIWEVENSSFLMESLSNSGTYNAWVPLCVRMRHEAHRAYIVQK